LRRCRILRLRQYHNQDRPDKRTIPLDSLPAPSVAIRAHCLECLDFRPADVKKCDGNLSHGKCHLWHHRLGSKRGTGSPGKAIRRECLECNSGSPKGVAECPSTRCALWPYRFGANPRTNREARAKFESARHPQSGFFDAKDVPATVDDPEAVPDTDDDSGVKTSP
jgi:hypothetical protein